MLTKILNRRFRTQALYRFCSEQAKDGKQGARSVEADEENPHIGIFLN